MALPANVSLGTAISSLQTEEPSLRLPRSGEHLGNARRSPGNDADPVGDFLGRAEARAIEPGQDRSLEFFVASARVIRVVAVVPVNPVRPEDERASAPGVAPDRRVSPCSSSQ